MILRRFFRSPRFRNLSVWHELTTGFFVVIALLLLVSGAALYQQQRSAAAINRLLMHDGRLVELVLKTNAQLSQARKLEKDFYLSSGQIGFTEAKRRFVDSLRRQLADVRVNVRQIRHLAGDLDMADRTRELERMLNAYEYGFLDAVDLQSSLGHFDSGLAGELRARAHSLEQRIRIQNRPQLDAIHLSTRRYEKDFMLRGVGEDVQRLKQTHSALAAAIRQSGMEDKEGQAILALSRLYLNAFNDYIHLTNELKERRTEYLNAVNAAEPLLEALHVAATARMERTSSTMLAQTALATRTVIVASTVAALIALLVSVLVARNVGRSVAKSMRFAEQIAAGNLDRHMELPDQKEFAVLAMALNKMADALRQSRIAQESRAVELERSVTERTRQLAGANALLTAEVETRRAAEAQLQAAKEAAEQATSAKSAFLANMSHEIRTPMNGIVGLTDLMFKTPMNPSQREFMDMIRSSSNALLRLLNDILDYSKMEACKLTLDAVEFDLHDMVGDAIKPFAAAANEKRLKLTCEIFENVPRAVVGDPGRLTQILVNLVGNAIKFTSAGDVAVRVALHHAQGAVATLAFEISDTGIGIEPSKQRHIFDAFAQADPSTTRQFGGTGLGLAIVREMIRLMNGSIAVNSRPGQGTLFRLTVPLMLAGDALPAASPLPGPWEDAEILVVDGHATSRRIVGNMLRSFRLTVKEASGATQALDLLREDGTGGRFPLALIDADMHGVDGFELVRALPSSTTPIMMLSSAEPSEDMRRCAELDIAFFLRKPFKRSELEAALRSAFGSASGAPPGSLAPALPASQSNRTLRVLVAEDHPINQRLVLEILKERGHEASVANNGREVLAMLENEPFDAILMDGQMPEMDGYQATAAIRERERHTGTHVRIIAVTAHAMARDRDACLAAGMDDYVSKPIDADQLIAKLEASPSSMPVPSDRPVAAARADARLAHQAVPFPAQVFNAESALCRARGKATLLREMMKVFRNELPGSASALKRTAQQHDAEAVERGAHRIRGAAAALGAERLADAAARVEQLGRDRTFAAMPAAIAHFEQCAAELDAAMDSHLREPA